MSRKIAYESKKALIRYFLMEFLMVLQKAGEEENHERLVSKIKIC